MQDKTTALDRSTYVGSSDIAALLGVSPWKTAFNLWEQKLGLADEIEDPEREVRLKRGKRFEPIILDAYQEESGAWIVNRNARYIDPQHEFLAAEIDAEEQDEDTGEITNLEIKSVSAHFARDFGPSGTDQVPLYYAAQVLYGLMVTGRPKAKLIALIGTDDLRTYEIPRDEELIAHIRNVAIDFWTRNVLREVPPNITNSADAARVIAKFEGMTIQTTNEVDEACRRIRGIKRAIKRLEEVQAKHELEIQLRMALATDGIEEPGRFAVLDRAGKPIVQWNLISRKGYTVAPTTYRKFTVK